LSYRPAKEGSARAISLGKPRSYGSPDSLSSDRLSPPARRSGQPIL